MPQFNCHRFTLFAVTLLVAVFSLSADLHAKQDKDDDKNPLLDVMKYRSIGPFRGGRSCAVTGVPGKPMTFYFGSTGGGVWRTDDGGSSWRNISDGYFGGSVGSIAIAPSDPNVIYVGGGEKTLRGNFSHGDGIWKSVDGGETLSLIHI